MDLSFMKSCFGFVIVVLVFSVAARNDPFQGQFLKSRELGFSKDHLINATNTRPSLLVSPQDYDGGSAGSDWINRHYCSMDNIYISQGQTDPLPNGIPTYTVQIQNICVPPPTGTGGCSISDIHVSCGWFSSARLINPSVFKRIAYDDCLVNGGNPTTPGQTVYFIYANTYSYPMSVSSMSCN